MTTSRETVVDYLEIPASDLDRTKAFFTQLFGWKFTDYGPEYCAFEDGRISGGFWKSERVASVSSGSVLVIFYAKDLEAAKARCESLGARISRDIFSFPGGRRFHFLVPGCGEFAIWSDGTKLDK